MRVNVRNAVRFECVNASAGMRGRLFIRFRNAPQDSAIKALRNVLQSRDGQVEQEDAITLVVWCATELVSPLKVRIARQALHRVGLLYYGDEAWDQWPDESEDEYLSRVEALYGCDKERFGLFTGTCVGR